jgi:hypothetical protein
MSETIPTSESSRRGDEADSPSSRRGLQRPTELPPELREAVRTKRFPRARRWLFNFAAALSLLLFVGNYWLWVRGASGKWDQIGIPWKLGKGVGDTVKVYKTIVVTSAEGRINFEVASSYYSIFPKTVPEDATFSMLLTDRDGRVDKADYLQGHFSKMANQVETPINRTYILTGGQPVCPKVFEGFTDDEDHYSYPSSELRIQIPKWFLQLLFAILPLWWLGRFALRWSEKRR